MLTVLLPSSSALGLQALGVVSVARDLGAPFLRPDVLNSEVWCIMWQPGLRLSLPCNSVVIPHMGWSHPSCSSWNTTTVDSQGFGVCIWANLPSLSVSPMERKMDFREWFGESHCRSACPIQKLHSKLDKWAVHIYRLVVGGLVNLTQAC